jgi:PhnB protein
MELNPYLTFNGNCRAAMNFYKDVFGGEFEGGMKSFSDGGDHFDFKPQDGDKIMHVHLKNDYFSILASDNMGDEFPFIGGNNFSMSLNISEDQVENIFDTLTENERIIMPFAEVFWGGKFGMLVDQLGIQWMVSTPH